MSDADLGFSIPVILGSVWRDRVGIRAARLMVEALRGRGHRPVLVDPIDENLPLLDRMYKEHPKGQAPAGRCRTWLAALYRGADGFADCQRRVQ